MHTVGTIWAHCWNRFKQALLYITTPHAAEIAAWKEHDGQWDEDGWP